MKYVCTPPEQAFNQISQTINRALEQGNVLLLLSGGSNIKAAVAIQQQLNLENALLTVSLVDERYGDVGHPDSNWQQLLDTGFDTSSVRVIPVLTGEEPKQTADAFGAALHYAFQNHDTVIGLLGMGSDGHTSGILPNSPAVTASDLVAYYQGPDYQRITTTAVALQHLDMAFLVAYGANKRTQLETLLHDSLPLTQQPVQLLKQLPDVQIYSDQPIPTKLDETLDNA